ncbi:phospholipase SGR2 isoform X2 [Cannabis sativa]|uniref:phospholipase SGR2 isoform X2 n=1 Tax=Cannabis sativa TaxID=3483 RepID=UPI0029CA8E9F|nr:phospholipase SGR2 isoform X2 [Cannabis sativa]
MQTKPVILLISSSVLLPFSHIFLLFFPITKQTIFVSFQQKKSTIFIFHFSIFNFASSPQIKVQKLFSMDSRSATSEGNDSKTENVSRRVEETSPELLKNTPSNIARLEDEIEQCIGRQKYLAQTRSPSDGVDVRWFFCKVPLAENELAASVPRAEIVGKGEYFRFGRRDSLAIEASFLQREEELLGCWWKEYAECSEGPIERPSSRNKLNKQVNISSSEGGPSTKLYEMEEERVGIPVKGGLYEVDLEKRYSFPVYWSGENRRVLRGHWFARKGGLDWLPLREDVAEQLEIAYRSKVWHRRRFQPSGLFAARVDLQGSLGLHALFTGEDDTWEAWLNTEASGFSSVITLGAKGIKLRRGYSTSHSAKPTQDEIRQRKEEEMDDYCSQVPVRHLVFMVHGIGQRLEKSNLVDDVGTFRHITASLAERHITQHQSGIQRVLFIPCQWRKGLKLSGETAVEKCTLDGVRGLRVMLSATAHDVLYYMSPIYCQDIINSVSNQLNQLYLKFLKRNPGYDGKVSIYGHSLGSVLSYDILCHQENLSSPFPMDSMYREHAEGDQSSASNSSLNLEVKTSASNNIEDMVGSIDAKNQRSSPALLIHEKGISSLVSNQGEKDSSVPATADDEKKSMLPTLLVHDVSNGNTEGVSTIVDTVAPDFNILSESVFNSNQSSCNEDVPESIYDPRGLVLDNRDNFYGTTDYSSGVCNDASELVSEEICAEKNDPEKKIKALSKELESLKVKIAELELQCDGEDRTMRLHKAPTTVVKQPICNKLPADHHDSLKSYTPYITYTKLEFKVDTFFAVGSPLGVFLALRNIRIGIGRGQDYWGEENINEEFPACQRMFNIFHPFDPVAYRVEPLVCKDYIGKRPVLVPYHKGGKRLHIGLQEFAEDVASRSQAMVDRLSSVRNKVLTVCQSRNDSEGEETAEVREERSYGSLMMEKLTGSTEGRIDHMLQDKTFQHPYIAAIGSHTNYWRDHDTALFILKHLYHDIPEDPNSTEASHGEDMKEASDTIGLSDQRETIEEELPLTFSDKSVVRNFSSRANKLLKKH